MKKILTIGFIFGLIWCIYQFTEYSNSFYYEEDKLKFDKKQWKVNRGKHINDENDRHFMLKDLLENYLKIGMDSAEVKALLGEPERDFGFSYNLGLYISPFDPTFLILEFDGDGKLSAIKNETI